MALVLCAFPRAAPASEGDGPSLQDQARGHIDAGNPKEAIGLLRGATDTTEKALLLARAYLDDGNDFWAMRTLHELAQRSDDCGPRLWLAFALFRQGALDEGRDLLEASTCPEDSPLESRRLLLEALLASTAGEPDDAKAALGRATAEERAFPEDVLAFRALRASLAEGYVHPLTGRLELHSGWTSNALAGSPADPAASGLPPKSPLANLSAGIRVTPGAGARRGLWPAPVIDGELRAAGIGAEAGRDQSYLQLSLRPALLFGERGAYLVGYRLDTLGVLGGDQWDSGPLLYFQAHRAELELRITPWLSAFGGGGHRAFREIRRNRLELDAGLGAAWRPVPRLSVLAAATGRYHAAYREVYDLYGATAIVQADWRLPRNLSARVGLMASLDSYPSSSGFFGTAEERRDILGKITAGLWLPRAKSGLRGGLTYELARRSSTAPDYGYTDHRVLLRGQWAFSFDPRGPRAALPAGHVPLAWGLESDDGALEETIQELLRQDEAVRAGSSCVE